ncbi:oxidoreductase [Planctomycetota bacterium]
MAGKIKIAVSWAAACGGCDVSLLDIEERILWLASVADVVYWPVAMDFKRTDLASYGEGEIDVGILNGAVRLSEQEHDARLMRSRCKVLVAYGACAAFGGIPGLANLHSREAILDTAYRDTASTENPEDLRPATGTEVCGCKLDLPEFHHTVKAQSHVVPIDYVVPGCPPTMERVLDTVNLIVSYARSGSLPEKGTVVASAKALCDECERVSTRTAKRITKVRRPHELVADPGLCFLEQGLLCMGIATRGGCGGACIGVNMPCRGCFGPTEAMLDPGAEALSAVGSIAAVTNEDDAQTHQRMAPIRSIVDITGTFYRFALPSATIFRALEDTPTQ